jgi:hypothetical protein
MERERSHSEASATLDPLKGPRGLQGIATRLGSPCSRVPSKRAYVTASVGKSFEDKH